MNEKLEQGKVAFKAGDRQTARKLLYQATKEEPNNEQTWGWLYNVCNTDQERIECLTQVVRINPGNSKARQILDQLQSSFPLESPPIASSPASPKKPSSLPSVPEDEIGGYVRSVLLPNERVLAVARMHWIIFSSPAVFILLGIISLITMISEGATLSAASASAASGTFVMAFFACGPFWLLGLIGIVVAFMRYKTTEFALTNKRLIGKTGIIKRNSLELVLGKVESIQVHQPVLGRFLDYGTLVVVGSGGTQQPFPHIANPMRLKHTINSILAE